MVLSSKEALSYIIKLCKNLCSPKSRAVSEDLKKENEKFPFKCWICQIVLSVVC